jgi:hypothetical protein
MSAPNTGPGRATALLLAATTTMAGLAVTATPAYATGAPTIVGMPAAGTGAGGSTLGGTEFKINGTGFATVDRLNPASVTFGGVNAASFAVLSSSQITVVAPPNATEGAVVDVRVTNPVGTSAVSAASKFTYRKPITVTVAPDTLLHPTVSGRLPVTVDLDLASAAEVAAQGLTATIGGSPAAITWVSTDSSSHSSALMLAVPAGTPSAEAVPVVVSRGPIAGIPDETNAHYAAVITSLSVTSGPAVGSPTATIVVTGKGLAGATDWVFGAVDASCAPASDATADTSWICISVPPAPVVSGNRYTGPVALRFTSATGPFAITVGGVYTYTRVF